MQISVLSRNPRGGQGGQNAGYSSLDSPSTTVYIPEPIADGFECTLPTTFLDTRYDQGGTALTWAHDELLTDTGNVTTNFNNLQTAITASLTRVGHTRLRLPDGWIHTGIPRCGVHTQGAYWTYVQRATRGAEGVQATQADLAAAPIFRTTTSNRFAVEFAPSANYWRFDDVVFESTAGTTDTLVSITAVDTNGDRTGSTVTDLPEYVYLSRCWIKGRNGGEIKNGLAMNCRAAAFVDGIIENIFMVGVESHSLVSFNGRGPFKIVNNYFDGGSINILFGGDNPFIQGFVPEDVEMRRNLFTMRDSWNQFHGSYDSVNRAIKNRLEFKCGKRVMVEGNILEKCPIGGGQNGEAFVIKSMAGEAGLNAPWFITQNICVRYNVGRNLWNWLYITGVQMAHLETLGGTDRIYIGHNLIHDYGDTGYGNTDNAHGVFWGDATNVAFDHMTVIPKAASISSYNPRSCMWMPDISAGASPGVRIVNSIFHAGRYEANRWAFTNIGTDGEAELDRVSNGDYVLDNSFMIDGPTSGTPWPSGEVTHVASIAAMNFTSDDPALGLDGDSPAKNAASDGTDAGCNYTKVNLATSGVA